MGCNHSKVNNAVIEPTLSPPSECGKPSDLAITEIIVDQDDWRSSESSSIEDGVVEDESVAPGPAQEEPQEPVVDGAEPTEVANIEEQRVVEEEVPVEEEEETPAEPEVEAEEEIQVEQDKSVEVEKSAVTETSAVIAPALTFTADKVAFTVGVAFFNIIGSTGQDDTETIHVTKRYSEFKVLHAEMAKLMSQEELPAMPGTSFLQGRNDGALLSEREMAFVTMLNAIARHPEASQSAPFVAFLA